MLLLLFFTLIWLKIVAGDTLIFFWRGSPATRALTGFAALASYGPVVLFWLIAWLVFPWCVRTQQSHGEE